MVILSFSHQPGETPDMKKLLLKSLVESVEKNQKNLTARRETIRERMDWCENVKDNDGTVKLTKELNQLRAERLSEVIRQRLIIGMIQIGQQIDIKQN